MPFLSKAKPETCSEFDHCTSLAKIRVVSLWQSIQESVVSAVTTTSSAASSVVSATASSVAESASLVSATLLRSTKSTAGVGETPVCADTTLSRFV